MHTPTRSRRRCGRAIALAAIFAQWGAAAFAGVIDSAPPVLSTGGLPARHIFTIPGVIKNNNLETFFACTSLESTQSFRFAVEVFAASGGAPLNNAGVPTLEGADTLLPGETRTIATGFSVGLHEDKVMTSLPAASLRNGSARVVSESRRIVCTAFVADEIGDPPASFLALKVTKAKKQNGD